MSAAAPWASLLQSPLFCPVVSGAGLALATGGGWLLWRAGQVQVPPSTPEETLEILAGLKGHYEKHHNVRFSEDTLKFMVKQLDINMQMWRNCE